MRTNPIAEIKMNNGSIITAELFPERVPNTVYSFVWAANKGYYDNYAIQRVEPNVVIDISYCALGRPECKYCIENESPSCGFENDLPVDLGSLCMGGYDSSHISGCEFFFPLAKIERWQGFFPVFGRIIHGLNTLRRIGSVELRPTAYQPVSGYVMKEPLQPQIIKSIRVDCFGAAFPPPIHKEDGFCPEGWNLF